VLKALIVGNAIDSSNILEKVRSEFKTTEVSNEFFQRNKLTLLPAHDLIWIHVETVLGKKDRLLLKNNVIISTTSTGYTHIAKEIVDFLGERLITLKGEEKLLGEITSTAELTWMLILIGATKGNLAMERVKAGDWDRKANIRDMQISSMKIGILGFGRLGKMVSKYARAFGSTVYVWDTDSLARENAMSAGFHVVSDFKELLQLSDLVTVHVNTFPGRSPIITSDVLKNSKRGLVLVNTSRGSIVDEEDITESIKSGVLAMYLTDVLKFEEEAGKLEYSPLWQFSVNDSRIVITPHIGGASRDAMHLCEENILERVKKAIHKAK
jgi:D-3-phosphoglycerate dehydrogenase